MQDKSLKAKEKALDMFSEARSLLALPNAPLGEDKDRIAKEFCLWRVDGIVELLPPIKERVNDTCPHCDNGTWEEVDNSSYYKYWNEVKTEIQAL